MTASTGTLAGRRVALGVGGGIAAYKAADLVRELGRAGAEVRVVMTPAARAFITPLTLQSLSHAEVLTELLEPGQEARFGHLEVSRWAELFIVAPATADLIARIRAGMGNDVVTTCLLAFTGKVLLAPAMNTAMWENPITRANVKALVDDGRFLLVGPDSGLLADGDVGAGRLATLPAIVEAAARILAPGKLAGRRVLITAGPTREPLDPVRSISNPSTGKMGTAVAAAARELGAQVTLVLGPVSEALRPHGVEIVDVETADQMLAAVLPRVNDVDYFVAAAAVSDWKAAEVSTVKEKKSDGPRTITLVRTPDVLMAASEQVHRNARRPILVGFAAETDDVLTYARDKLARKRLDFIVANRVGQPGSGFGGDSNSVHVLGVAGQDVALSGSKLDVARGLWDLVAAGQGVR